MRHDRRLLFVFIVALVVITGCDGPVRGPGSKANYQNLLFNTSDGVLIGASFYDSPSSRGIILLHDNARDRSVFRDVANRLQPDYKVVIIDFRGHGISDMEFQDLTENDYNNMVLDVKAAADYLSKHQGVESLSLAGASIGANIALVYASEHPVDKLILLSPGGRYRGVDISRIYYRGPLLAQVANYDGYSSISADELSLNWDGGRVMRYDTNAHGSDLLRYDVSAAEDFYFYLT